VQLCCLSLAALETAGCLQSRLIKGVNCSRINFFFLFPFSFSKIHQPDGQVPREEEGSGRKHPSGCCQLGSGHMGCSRRAHPALAPACWARERGTAESWPPRMGMRPESCRTRLGEPCGAAPCLLAAAVAGLLGFLALWILKPF